MNTRFTALTLIDEIIGGLCRGGPAKDRTFGCYTRESLPGRETALVCELLGAQKVQPLINEMVTLDLGSLVIPHALKLARASLEVLVDSIPKLIKLPLVDQLSAYRRMSNWALDDFVTNAKFMVVYPMARFLHNDIPQRPSSFDCHPLVYTGRIKRILKNRLVSFSLKNCSLWQGVLQGIKRGAEVVPKSFIKKAMVKHRAALTKEPEVYFPHSRPERATGVSWFEATELDEYFSRFFRSFRPPRPELFEASAAASFESKRSEGGAREFLRNEQYRLIENPFTGDFVSATDPEGGFATTVTPDVLAVYSLLDEDFGDLLEMYEVRPGQVEEVRGRATWSDYYELYSQMKNMDLHNKVQVSAVLEPLKVRLITKGETFKYYLSRFYQKGLWNYLKKFPQFALTNRPLRTDDFEDLKVRESKLGLDFSLWVSGDYSAATDNLKLFYTKMAFEKSLAVAKRRGKYTEQMCDFLRAVLYEQELNYPDSMNQGDLDPVIQTTGQLMGSTLSFPILCTVNLCAYWLSLERFLGKRVSLKDLPVLVNGDDILFRTNPQHYKLWLAIVREVGFELSLGKNYIHKSFLTVNSTGFLDAQNGFVEVPYLNAGLLTGQSKLAGRISERVAPIWDYYNFVMDGARDKPRAHRRFLHYHKENVEKVTEQGNYSLFSHPLLGGLGFKLHPELKSSVRFTAFQRRFGDYLRGYLLQPFEGEWEKFRPFRGIVTERKSRMNMRRKFHCGNYEVRPITAPMNWNEREILNVEEKMSNLAWAYNLDQPSMVVRPPDHKVLEGFRASRTHEVNVSRLLSFPFKYVEVVKFRANLPKEGTIETNPGPRLCGELFSWERRKLENYELDHIRQYTFVFLKKKTGELKDVNCDILYQHPVWDYGDLYPCEFCLGRDLFGGNASCEFSSEDSEDD